MGRKLGLLNDQEYEKFCRRRDSIEKGLSGLRGFSITPDKQVSAWFESQGWSPPRDRVTGEGLMRRSEVTWDALSELGFDASELTADVREQIEIQIRYEGYIQRDLESLEGIRKNEGQVIPAGLDYTRVPGLSMEAMACLTEVRPETIGQATRMMGVTPASVASLVIYLRMGSGSEVALDA
jgi:tRNA uridine 5-carboxymethylaminomethyl modification enzyme